MSQFFSQIPAQLMQQRMTPQLIQAMDILQLNAMALESRIQQEIDGNPALEVLPNEDEVSAPAEAESTGSQKEDGERAMEVAEGSGHDFERLDNLVREYTWLDEDEYRGTRSRAGIAEEGDMKQEAMNNTAARAGSLQDYLMEQWRLAEVDEETRRIGSAIIDSLNEAGRLDVPLEQIAREVQPPSTPEQVEQALLRVQGLEPPGIAARTLQEGLLLQLAALPGDNELEISIVRDHFEDLQKNRLPHIAKALGVDVDEIKEALHTVGRLSLHPGFDVVERNVPTIVPDVLVDWNDEEQRYEVRLARNNQRELRISPEFREALEKARGDKQAREFLKQKIEAANAIIDAVKYRRERLLDVAKAAVEAQTDFLEKGEQHLKVLRMSDLAERFNCDPSTISRTVDEKYLETPRGVYPLRRFFTGGTESDNGDALGWDSIKAKVQEIVEKENKSDPLSDDQIVEHLQAEGIDIKRRTVAKYRAQLGIPTKNQRKQY